MKSRELAELRKKDVDELGKLLAEKRRTLLDERFSKATGALEDQSRVRKVKRDVAQILTVLNERSASGAAVAAE